MCRLLLARSPKLQDYRSVWLDFAQMAKRSRTMDGDRQSDGWGIAWLDSSQQWQHHRSLLPIWEDLGWIKQLPPTTTLLTHARSASWPQQKGIPAYNQPYLKQGFAFVFNGFLQGVQLPQPVPGKIGAQKIFNLFLGQVKNNDPAIALDNCAKQLTHHCRYIQGANLIIVSPESAWVVSLNPHHFDYFQLRQTNSNGVDLICSEPLAKWKWSNLPTAKVLTLN